MSEAGYFKKEKRFIKLMFWVLDVSDWAAFSVWPLVRALLATSQHGRKAGKETAT
jgi:hypothetical protein